MEQWTPPDCGTLRVKEFGTNSASRKARAEGKIEKAKEIETRCFERHNAILAEGYVYNKGCKRFTLGACVCCKCRKTKINIK